MANPSVSVVLPCYNRRNLVGQAIESALAQNFPPDEIVVVDDGSQDGSGDVAERYGSPVRVVRTPNRGPSAARNQGIAEATGEWIAFLDSDDVWAPDKLHRQFDALETFPAAGLVFCDTVVREGEQTVIDSRFDLGGVREHAIERCGDAYRFDRSYFEPLLRSSRIFTSAVVVRRDAEGLRFDESLRTSEDWDLWLRLSLRHEFVAVDAKSVTMWQQGDNLSRDHAKISRTDVRVLEGLLEREPLSQAQRAAVDEFLNERRFSAAYFALLVGDGAETRRQLDRMKGTGRMPAAAVRYRLASYLPGWALRTIARARS